MAPRRLTCAMLALAIFLVHVAIQELVKQNKYYLPTNNKVVVCSAVDTHSLGGHACSGDDDFTEFTLKVLPTPLSWKLTAFACITVHV